MLTGRARRPPRVVSDGNPYCLTPPAAAMNLICWRSNLPDVAVVVDKDRVKSGRYAIDKLKCDTGVG